jgi:hypothetical protein
MKYKIQQTLEAEGDIFELAHYRVTKFGNFDAADDFLAHYYQEHKV